MAYLYFNKTAFRKLVNLWLRMGCCHCNYVAHGKTKDEYVEWLMGAFMPIKFIDDIEQQYLKEKIENVTKN